MALRPAGPFFASGARNGRVTNAFVVSGDIEGYAHYTGLNIQIDTRTGRGNAAIKGVLHLTQPGFGTFECVGHSKLEGYPLEVVQIGYSHCKGTGDFDGVQFKARTSNEDQPGSFVYDAVAEVWQDRRRTGLTSGER